MFLLGLGLIPVAFGAGWFFLRETEKATNDLIALGILALAIVLVMKGVIK